TGGPSTRRLAGGAPSFTATTPPSRTSSGGGGGFGWTNPPKRPQRSAPAGLKTRSTAVPTPASPVACGAGGGPGGAAGGMRAEGYTGRNGWAIEGRPESSDQEAVDAADAAALYSLLEENVVPTFYDRDPQGIPRRWLSIVRQAIISVAPRFSARRMVREYAED